ncbi:hypothetical protein SUGI_0932170 [Cryptomeria japonica]|nr:hypothetical protein SUGI_0932170 [Cryptomeria japonica]
MEEIDLNVKVVKPFLVRSTESFEKIVGRLKLNSEQGRLEIDCNGEGALFASAPCDLRMDQLPDIAYRNPAFAQFILQEYGVSNLHDLPLLFLQVCIFLLF